MTTTVPPAPNTADSDVDLVSPPARLDFDAHAPGFTKVLGQLDHSARQLLDRAGIEPGLRELLKLRASQLNGCAYCVDMHTKDARAGAESEDRITGLPVWEETPFFTARERAALAFVESVVQMSSTHVPQSAYDAVAAHFDDDGIAALVALVVSISAWNAIGVSTRTWVVGSYSN